MGPGRGLPSAASHGTLAPPRPSSRRRMSAAQMALLCSCSLQRRRAGVLTSPANASLCPRPSSACLNIHLSASTIECPPAAQLSLESLDSVFKQRNSSECVAFPGEKRVTGKELYVDREMQGCWTCVYSTKAFEPILGAWDCSLLRASEKQQGTEPLRSLPSRSFRFSRREAII